MTIKNLKKDFSNYCKVNKLKINNNQIRVIELLIKFYINCFNKSFFSFFKNKDKKLGFYLFGDVGVGKTMLLNFFYENLDIPKQRLHFNEFMISFHDFSKKNIGQFLFFLKGCNIKCNYYPSDHPTHSFFSFFSKRIEP